MADYLIAASDSGGINFPFGATRYTHPLGWLTNGGTEARAQLRTRAVYTWQKLYARVSANNIDAGNTVIRSRINGANGSQVVTIPFGTTGAFEDNANSDAVASGDLIDFSVVSGGTVGNCTVTSVASRLTSAIGAFPFNSVSVFQNFGAVTFFPINGRATGNGTETNSQYTFRAACAFIRLRVYIQANTLNANATVRTRINVGDGTLVVTIPAGITGELEDAVNTDNVVAGDEICHEFDTTLAGAGSITLNTISMTGSGTGKPVISGSSGVNTFAANQTRYLAPDGDNSAWNATEANVQVETRCAFTARNMFVNVAANNINGNTVFTLRQASVPSTLTITVPAATTGLFEDLVNSVPFALDDLIDWEIAAAGAVGTMLKGPLGFQLDQPAVGGGPLQGSLAHKLIGAGVI